MIVYFFIIFILYYIFIVLMIFGWNSLVPPKNIVTNHKDFISLIIAVRNEEKNIRRLLDCLADQSLPDDQYEVIIIDDGSLDDTTSIIEAFTKKFKISIRLLKSAFNPEQKITPKKAALLIGIEAALGSVVAMTDGDCRFGKDWLKSISDTFADEKIMFVSGPVALEGNNSFLSKIQTLELASLIGTGAAMIRLNYPLMCNGANLAFRKSAFEKVNGYEGFENQASGDDVFLMQKIHRAFPGSVKFLKSSDALVMTDPQATAASLINQRRRWASKWNRYLLPGSLLLPVFLLVHYLSFLPLIGLLFYDFTRFWPTGILLAFKIFLDYLFLKKVMIFCKLQFRFSIFLISGFLYPIYAVFIGLSAQIGNYSWKGRTYKT